MAVPDDAGAIRLCRFRVALLSATGAPVTGATAGFSTDKQMSLAFNPVNSETPEIEVTNGCGDIILAAPPESRFKRVNLVLTLGTPNPELASILADFALIADGGTNIGASYPAIGAVPDGGVYVEAYAQAWDQGSQDAALPYWVFAFTNVSFTPGDQTLENAALAQVFNGVGVENDAITADGPFDDWPTIANPERAVHYWRTATLPAASDTFISVP